MDITVLLYLKFRGGGGGVGWCVCVCVGGGGGGRVQEGGSKKAQIIAFRLHDDKANKPVSNRFEPI